MSQRAPVPPSKKPEAPAESKVLDNAYRKSGLTAADLAVATGLSVGSIRIALSGLRYRKGEVAAVAPPDQTLAKLASVLGIGPAALIEAGRERAAAILRDAKKPMAVPDLNAAAAIAGREALARQVLAVFSTEEIRDELGRRSDDEAWEQEGIDDAAAYWRETRL